jgi:hypothetical protein
MPTNYIEELVKFLDDPKIRCKVNFGTREDDSTLKLWETGVRDKARDQFRQGFLAEARRLVEKKATRYSLSDEESDTYLYIDISEIPGRVQYLKDPVAKLPKLDGDFIDSIRFLEFRFQNVRSKIVSIYRYNQKTNFLLKGEGAFYLSEAYLSPVDQDIVVTRPEIHCAFIDNVAIIFHRGFFEKLFGYTKEFERSAKKVFEHLESQSEYSIADLDGIRENCYDHISDLRALTRIDFSEKYKSWTYEKIKDLAKQRGLKITFDDKTRTITFGSKRAFLHVYDDDYLDSPMTGSHYVALKKKAL